MQKTLMATAVAVLLGASGAVMANTTDQDTLLGNNTSNSTMNEDYSSTTNTATTTTTTRTPDNSINKNSGAATASAARSVALNNGATGNFSNAFNVTTAVASSNLTGYVSGNAIRRSGKIVAASLKK